MRDLLYLSESKMQALVPQLPGRTIRRLGLEAGVSAGLISLKVTLPGEVGQQPRLLGSRLEHGSAQVAADAPG
jgi:hypothetical protein